MKSNIVIMCGGEGHRLWPKSTTKFPKQFISLDGEKTLLQQTINLFNSLNLQQNFGFFTHKEFLPILKIQLVDDLENYQVFLESVSCNTGPLIALAALYYLKHDPDSILIFSPADQYILEGGQFNISFDHAVKAAAQGNLVTLGVRPTYPATEYGYIKVDAQSSMGVKNITQFLEKPEKKVAEDIYKDEAYYWNSGIFIAKPQTYINFLKHYSPFIFEECSEVFKNTQQDQNTILFEMKALQKASLSFDQAVMEKANKGKLVPLESGFNDLGNWDALSEVDQIEKDNIKSYDSKNCYVNTKSPTILMGVSDLIIAEAPNGLLVTQKGRASNLTKLSKEIQTNQAFHTFELRPWGYFKNISKGVNYLLKEITIAPHSRLSLQLHEFRNEFWFVSSGSGIVVIEDSIRSISTGDFVIVPVKTKHRLENNTDKPLIVIEIQFGALLSEDDIIRYADDYRAVPL